MYKMQVLNHDFWCVYFRVFAGSFSSPVFPKPSSLAPVDCKTGKSILFCAEAFLLCLLRKRGWNIQIFQPSTFPSPSMIWSWTDLVMSEEIIFPYNNHRANFDFCSVFPSSNYRTGGKQVWQLPAGSPFD